MRMDPGSVSLEQIPGRKSAPSLTCYYAPPPPPPPYQISTQQNETQNTSFQEGFPLHTRFIFFLAVLGLNLGLVCVKQAPTTWDISPASLRGVTSTTQLQASCTEPPQSNTASLSSYDPSSDPDTRISGHRCLFHASSVEILVCLFPSLKKRMW